MMKRFTFLIGVAVGAAIGWLSELYLMKGQFSAEGDALRMELGIAQRQAKDLERRLEAAAAELNDARTKRTVSRSDTQIARLESNNQSLQHELDAAQTKLEELRTQLAVADEQAEPAEATDPDDLKAIEGIGPKIAAALNAAGVATFQQVADSSAETLATIVREAGVRGGGRSETWPEQATLAAAGQWDALKLLQDTLQGGRRTG